MKNCLINKDALHKGYLPIFNFNFNQIKSNTELFVSKNAVFNYYYIAICSSAISHATLFLINFYMR